MRLQAILGCSNCCLKTGRFTRGYVPFLVGVQSIKHGSLRHAKYPRISAITALNMGFTANSAQGLSKLRELALDVWRRTIG